MVLDEKMGAELFNISWVIESLEKGVLVNSSLI